jgi:hypothetical protein
MAAPGAIKLCVLRMQLAHWTPQVPARSQQPAAHRLPERRLRALENGGGEAAAAAAGLAELHRYVAREPRLLAHHLGEQSS